MTPAFPSGASGGIPVTPLYGTRIRRPSVLPIMPNQGTPTALDQEEGWTTAVLKVVWNPVVFQDDTNEMAYLFLDQEEGYQPLVVRQSIPWNPVFVTDTDEQAHANLANFGLDEEWGWQPQPMQVILWNNITIRYDEEGAGLSSLHVDQDDGWRDPGTVRIVWNPVVFTDDETQAGLKYFFLEQEEGFVDPGRTRIPWTPVVFVDDTMGSQLAGLGLDQEEGYQPQPQQSILWLKQTWADDETCWPLIPGFGLDQVEEWRSPVQLRIWNPVIISDDLILGYTLTPTMTVSPGAGTTGTSLTVTATGVNTNWLTSTVFTVTGGSGAFINSIVVSSNTAAIFNLTVGSAAGTLTIHDSTDAATAPFTAVAPSSGGGGAAFFTTATPYQPIYTVLGNPPMAGITTGFNAIAAATIASTAVNLANGTSQFQLMAVNAGGSGYVFGDTITISGGTGIAATAMVTGVSSTGAVQALAITNAGYYATTATPGASNLTTTGGTGTGLTVNPTYLANTMPVGTKAALISAIGNTISYRSDGAAPAAGTGMQLAAGQSLYFDRNLANFQVIAAASGASVAVEFLG